MKDGVRLCIFKILTMSQHGTVLLLFEMGAIESTYCFTVQDQILLIVESTYEGYMLCC